MSTVGSRLGAALRGDLDRAEFGIGTSHAAGAGDVELVEEGWSWPCEEVGLGP